MARKEAPSIPPGTILGGKYALGQKLGQGGMGAVFEAQDPQGRIVAVKTLLVVPGAHAAAAETRARFEREISTTSRLVHKNVLSLIDHGAPVASSTP